MNEPTATVDAQSGERWLSARLSPAEMDLLDRQGFVSRERLPSGAVCAKLRFRNGRRRQRVVYVGVEPRLAEQIAAHLAVRQAATRRRKACTRLRRRGRRLLQSVRPSLEPHLCSDEWHFHGRQLRRRRRCAAEPLASPAPPTTSKHGVYLTMNDPLANDSGTSNYDGMRRWAKVQPSPFDAAIGHLTADLCEIAVDLAGQVKADLREALDGGAGSKSFRENLHSYLQVTRQVDRFIQMAPRTQTSPTSAKNHALDTYEAGEPPDTTGEVAPLPARKESEPSAGP